VAVNLRVKGFEYRHWTQLSEKLGLKLSPKIPNFNLKHLVNNGLHENVDILEEISIKAQKE